MGPRPGPRLVVALLAALTVALALAPASVQAPASTQAPAGATASSALVRKLDTALAGSGVPAARRGAIVIELESGQTIFARNPRIGLAPASNEKLPVAYAAISLLGPGYRIPTEVLGEGVQEGDEWLGDLYLKGYGDPDLTRYDLRALAARVRAAGISWIRGDLVGDESAFDGRRMVAGWKSSYYIEECNPLSALAVDRSRDTSASPPLVAVRHFSEALEKAGVTVEGRIRLGTAPEEATRVTAVNSPPLSQILRFMNRESDNYTAELLLKQIGLFENGKGTSANGASLVTEMLADLDAPLGGVRIVDGSGLSRLDRLSPEALGVLLAEAWADPEVSWTFVSSLAIAGRNGTLERRLRTRPAAGIVRAKTGTTRNSSALSGYVGDRYAFVIIQNGWPVPAEQARVAQDRFVTALAAQSG